MKGEEDVAQDEITDLSALLKSHAKVGGEAEQPVAVKPCAVIVGDLNSCPHTGPIQYLTT